MQIRCKSVEMSATESVRGVSQPDGCENARNDAPAQPPNTYLKSWPLAIVTTSLCLGTFLVALDVNVIGVAVPKITAVFKSLDDIAWYGSAYLLTVTAFQPMTGFVYKFFSVRITYLSSILVFEGTVSRTFVCLAMMH